MYKKRNFTSKIEEEAIIYDSVVQKIDYKNQEVNEKLKNCFYVKSENKPEGVMCILWGRSSINVGDYISMKGRLKDGVFLAWSLQILKRGLNEIPSS